MAKHRDDTYFSFHELNRMIRKELDAANERPFQKMEGSRRSVFEQTERHALHPLPLRPYEMAEFKEARVAPDYHVEFKGNFYSVPYRFVKDTVDIRATHKTYSLFSDYLFTEYYLEVKELFCKKTLKIIKTKILYMLSDLSFGVYLIHMLVLETIRKFCFSITSNSIISLLILFSGTLLISYIITYLLKKTKYTVYLVK